MKRVLRIVLLSAFLLLLGGTAVLMLRYGSDRRKEVVCGKVEISIERQRYDIYLQNRDVERCLAENGIELVGKRNVDINTSRVESVLLRNPYVSDAQVYFAQNGNCRLQIDQRNPFLKVVGSDGQMFQIDRKGFEMPVNTDYAVRLRVASGYIPFAPQYGLNVTEIADTLPKVMLKRLYQINAFLEADPLWNAMFEQIYVTYAGEYELIPKVGGQVVRLGRVEDMRDLAEKMERLALFYRKCASDGILDRYSVLNLKYKRQLVAVKRPGF